MIGVACPRCGRQQPILASPCPECGLLDSGAFNPDETRPPEVVCVADPHVGAETPESSKPEFLECVTDPRLRAAVLAAYRAWEKAL
jgi:hypothetical protein